MIITAHTSRICSYTLGIVHITSTKTKFSCFPCEHSQFLCNFKFQTVIPGCPPSPPHTFWSTAIRRDIRAALYFCSCELRWRSIECVLLPCFNALGDIFAVMNCSVLALSAVFCFCPLTWRVLTNQFVFITVTHCNLQQRVKSACIIICIGTPENGGMAGDCPLCSFKRRATGAEVPFP